MANTRVLPTGLFIVKPEKKNMTFLTVSANRKTMIHSVLAEGKIPKKT
jgi:hypothetical protein